MRWACLSIAGLAAGLLTGCPDPTSDPDIELYSFTKAPVGRTATVRNIYDPPEYDIEISSGVAVGVACWDSCDYNCIEPTVTSDDEGIVRIREVYRASTSTPQHVLIAVAPGNTQVNVRTACAQKSYPVRVLEE